MTPRQPDSPSKTDTDDNRQKELKRLVEIYAMRTREFSEAVATLGSLTGDPARFEEAITEIKKLRNFCEKAGGDLFLFVMRLRATRHPGSAIPAEPLDDPEQAEAAGE